MSERPTTEFFELTHTNPGQSGNRIAHAGYVYRCRSCGKRSRDRYGVTPIDPGYDEACALKCMLEAA